MDADLNQAYFRTCSAYIEDDDGHTVAAMLTQGLDYNIFEIKQIRQTVMRSVASSNSNIYTAHKERRKSSKDQESLVVVDLVDSVQLTKGHGRNLFEKRFN